MTTMFDSNTPFGFTTERISTTSEIYCGMAEALRLATEILPRRQATNRIKSHRSEATKQLYIRRKRELQGMAPGPQRNATRNTYAKLILHQAREDWRIHICNQINEISDANDRDDAKAVWKGVAKLAGSGKTFSTTQPTCDLNTNEPLVPQAGITSAATNTQLPSKKGQTGQDRNFLQ